jgi:polysaccharide biosynthesis/export protein
MKRTPLFIALVAALSMSGCGLHHAAGYSEILAQSPTAPYTLATGDRLRVIVFGQDGLSNSYAVDPAGMVSMPLIGAVHAQGRTTQALESAIAQRLRGGYLRDPKVSVEIEQYRPFFILGEVVQSGQFPFVNGMTVQTAIAIAGGFQPRANRHYAEITRMMNGETISGRVPLDAPVRPGDTITVRERYF